jgi:membrane protein
MTFDVVCALWFASGGVKSMISALNLASRVHEARSWFKVRTLALGLTLLISILLLAALLFVVVSTHFVEWLGTELPLRPMVVLIWKAIRWPGAIVFATTSYSVIYYCGPDLKERRWHWTTPGSAIGASLSLPPLRFH